MIVGMNSSHYVIEALSERSSERPLASPSPLPSKPVLNPTVPLPVLDSQERHSRALGAN